MIYIPQREGVLSDSVRTGDVRQNIRAMEKMTSSLWRALDSCPESLQHFVKSFLMADVDCESCQKWRLRLLSAGIVSVAGAASWLYFIYPLAQRFMLRGLPHTNTSSWVRGDKDELDKYVQAGEKRLLFSHLRNTVGPNCFLRLPLQFSPCAMTKNPFGLIFVTSDWSVVQELSRASNVELVRNPEWVRAFELIPKSTIALSDEQLAQLHRRILTTFTSHDASKASVKPLLQLLNYIKVGLAELGDRRAVDVLQLVRLAMLDYWLGILTGCSEPHCLRGSGHLALTPRTVEEGSLPYSTAEALLTLTRFHLDNYERLFLPTDSREANTHEHKTVMRQYKSVLNAQPIILSQLLNTANSDALLPKLLAAKDSVSQRGLNVDEIKDNCAMLLLAADNTALPIVWALYELAKNPRLQDQIFKAVAAQSIDISALSSPADLVAHFGEVMNLFLETLRFYPVPAITRTAATSIVLKAVNITIPCGSLVVVDNFSLTRDPVLWGADAEQFDPTRFVGRVWQQAPWVPFGFGPRKCLGPTSAITHAVVFLSFIIQHFSFSLDPHSVTPLPVEKMFLTPDKPVMLRFTPRHPV